jgi:hypothetical protein
MPRTHAIKETSKLDYDATLEYDVPEWVRYQINGIWEFGYRGTFQLVLACLTLTAAVALAA